MKKIPASLLAITLFLTPFACSKAGSGATIEVTVKNLLLENVPEKKVYLFLDQIPTNPKPSDAKKQMVTNSKGVAVFRLNFSDLKIVESQTLLYFGVFVTAFGQETLRNSDPITVQFGDEKSVVVSIPR
jgi:hypothetical protein